MLLPIGKTLIDRQSFWQPYLITLSSRTRKCRGGIMRRHDDLAVDLADS
jgi:hypothetical protein